MEVYGEGRTPDYIQGISLSRNDLLNIYAILCSNINNVRGSSISEVVKYNDWGLSSIQTAFALSVFLQLGLISFESGAITVYRGVKTELTNSPLYNRIAAIQNGDR